MTSKKRRYGNPSPQPIDEDVFESVFDKVAGRQGAGAPTRAASKDTAAPATLVSETNVSQTNVAETMAAETIVLEAKLASQTNVASDQAAPEPQTNVAAETNVASWAIVQGFTPVPNTVLDTLSEVLDVYSFKVYLRLFRLSHGYRSANCQVGFEKLARKTNISMKQAQRAVEKLEALGLVKKLGAVFSGDRKGNRYEVIVPGTLAAETKVAAETKDGEAGNKDSINKNQKDALRAEYVELLARVKEQFSGAPRSVIASNLRAAVHRRQIKFDEKLISVVLNYHFDNQSGEVGSSR
jgi:DNA-binding Lrp family transcriptional regulator